MDRRTALVGAVAFLIFPSVIAALSWESGMAQVVGVFVAMILLDALILGLAYLVQGKEN